MARLHGNARSSCRGHPLPCESKKQLEIDVTQEDIQARTAQFDKVLLPSGRKVTRAPAVDFQKKGVYFPYTLYANF
ncbi:MAG: hypothetical protein JW709_05425 [Sedimentisphaerales bacterium]|nr:hypothetical protein [Sedimentisphaerales bacterium]